MSLRSKLPRFDRVLSSPTRTAVETAAALGLEADVEPALRECDYGRWSGRPLDEVAASEPDALAAWLADAEASPHGGETLAALCARVAGWLESDGLDGRRTVAVAHASVIRAAVLHALAAPRPSFWRIDVAPLSMTRFGRSARGWTLSAMNEAPRGVPQNSSQASLTASGRRTAPPAPT